MIRKISAPFFVIVLLAILALTVNAEGQSVVPIGANSNWSTDLWLRNLSSVPITQNIGSLNVRLSDGSIRTIRTDITLAARETRYVPAVSLNFDNGLWILAIDPRLESSVALTFQGGQNRFELNGLSSPFIHFGDSRLFHRVSTDFFGQIGSWIMVLNTGSVPHDFELLISGPRDGEDITRESFSAPPGIYQYPVRREIPQGGTILACLGGCALSSPGEVSPVYLFTTTGPWNGGQFGLRYPESP